MIGAMTRALIGHVACVFRYPVKSMAAEAVASAEVSWNGVAGDRRWAFIRPGLERSNFPWLTIRQRSDMASFVPRFEDPADPDASAAIVRTPAGAEFEVADPALASELGDGVRVIKQNRGVFDALPLSLITAQTVAGLGTLVGRDLDVRRFRPNLVIEATGSEPFQEDAWVGRTITIGAFQMRLDDRDPRCVMINVDPATGERDPAVLRAVAQERTGCLGLYGSTARPGTVAVGDVVTIA